MRQLLGTMAITVGTRAFGVKVGLEVLLYQPLSATVPRQE